MKILYFSWIKDKIGKTHEDIDIRDNIKTIEELIAFLKKSNESYEEVFKDT